MSMSQLPNPSSASEDPEFVRLSGREWLILASVCAVAVLVTAILVFNIGSKLPHVG